MEKPEKMISPEHAFAQMARLCSRKECSVWDVQQKLKRMKISDDAAAQIIDRLKKGRYIDELRYTRSYIHDKFTFNKWGKTRIVHSLRQKQIPDEIIEIAFSEFSDTALNASLPQLLEAKRKTVKGQSSYEIKGKLIRYALGRGFLMEDILACLQKMDPDEMTDGTE